MYLTVLILYRNLLHYVVLYYYGAILQYCAWSYKFFKPLLQSDFSSWIQGELDSTMSTRSSSRQFFQSAAEFNNSTSSHTFVCTLLYCILNFSTVYTSIQEGTVRALFRKELYVAMMYIRKYVHIVLELFFQKLSATLEMCMPCTATWMAVSKFTLASFSQKQFFSGLRTEVRQQYKYITKRW